MSRRLAELVADPSRVARVPREQAPVLLAELERLRVALWLRVNAPAKPATNGTQPDKSDRMLDVNEAAQRLGVGVRWLYRHADELPFTRRLGTRTLRFSEEGVDRWLATR